MQKFFSSSKRVRGLSAPIEGSPSTQSPSVKRTEGGTPQEKSIQPEYYVRRQDCMEYLAMIGANLTT